MRATSTRSIASTDATNGAAYLASARPARHGDPRGLEQTRDVVGTRTALWAAALDEPAHRTAVLELVEARCDAPSVLSIVARLRELPRVAARDELDAAVAALAHAIAWTEAAPSLPAALIELASVRSPAWAEQVRRAAAAHLAARDRVVRTNLPLVALFAKRYRCASMPLEDRIQEGTLGLMKAVDRFDPERGTQFSTYAVWWIRCAIARAISSTVGAVRVPSHVQVLARKAEAARRRLASELGREPEIEEIARAMNVAVRRLSHARTAMAQRVLDLDAPHGADHGGLANLADSAEIDALGMMVEAEEQTAAVAALSQLPAKTRDILEQRLAVDGEELTLAEVGQRHGISRERVRQLQRRALDDLRRTMESRERPSMAPFVFAAAASM